MERLQKVMARAGVASRRKCEELIKSGRVSVNGEIAELGSRADPASDSIELDGRPLPPVEQLVYLLLHKPGGVLCSARSQGGHPTVLDIIDVDQRVYPVGRLDLDSEGLVLLTNDGELAHRLSHPRFEHEKEYRVLLDRHLDQASMAKWRAGPEVEGLGRLTPAKLDRTDGAWVTVILREGRKRQIRRTAEHLGYRVTRLIRTRLGPQELGNLEPGESRRLSQAEVARLRRIAELPVGRRAPQEK